jgi:ribonucleoside-diphosphate reductase alpha chain
MVFYKAEQKDYHGIKIHTDTPSFITPFTQNLLNEFYSNKTISEMFAIPAIAFCGGDLGLAQRIYGYVYNNWFMYASPILSNAPEGEWVNNKFIRKEEKLNGLPISCFAFTIPDTINGQVNAIQEMAILSVSGGGTGVHNQIRGISKKAPGPIPFFKVLDSSIGYFRQGASRRGSLAVYMDVSHPDIIEHIRFRVPGGDEKRKSNNRQQFHSAVNITDKFINAVLNDEDFDLVCPHSGKVFETLKARYIWEEILETRALTGEPYIAKIDLINRLMPQSQKELGLKIYGSNLCSEITLPTNEERTFVCCLSSLNIEKYDEWKDTSIVEDLITFLDNVLQFFIDNCPDTLSKARFSATKERALGLGTFGFHSYLQSKMIALESGGVGSASQLSHTIYKNIKDKAVKQSRKLAIERGEPDDMKGTGLRNSCLLAIAPNSNSADIANTSPSIEPYYRNIFVKETRAGTYTIKNKYLEKILEEKELNKPSVWKDILDHNGSVQHLDFLTDNEKKVFRTAMEIDQHWLIELANIRGQFICQAQSLNLFFPSGVNREYVNSVHLKFLKSDFVKTLYYYRTEKEGKVNNAKQVEVKTLVNFADTENVECLACQG